jgi:hypothetical protein
VLLQGGGTELQALLLFRHVVQAGHFQQKWHPGLRVSSKPQRVRLLGRFGMCARVCVCVCVCVCVYVRQL